MPERTWPICRMQGAAIGRSLNLVRSFLGRFRVTFGLFLLMAVACTTPSAIMELDEVAAGDDSLLPFGAIARNCSVSGEALGSEVTRGSGFRIYDTQPGGTSVRTHFITGFSDGCARQFSAALVLMGDIGTHEVVRYAETGVTLPYSDTDDAYETIKNSFCGVRRGQPCGSRIDRLARSTTFVSVYESFGTSPRWADILLHRGEVIAKDMKEV